MKNNSKQYTALCPAQSLSATVQGLSQDHTSSDLVEMGLVDPDPAVRGFWAILSESMLTSEQIDRGLLDIHPVVRSTFEMIVSKSKFPRLIH